MPVRLLVRLSTVTYSCSVHQSKSTNLPHTICLPQWIPAVFPLWASCWFHSALGQVCISESFYTQSYSCSIYMFLVALPADLVPYFPHGFSFSLASGPREKMHPSCCSTKLGCCKECTHLQSLQLKTSQDPQSSCLLWWYLCAYAESLVPLGQLYPLSQSLRLENNLPKIQSSALTRSPDLQVISRASLALWKAMAGVDFIAAQMDGASPRW